MSIFLIEGFTQLKNLSSRSLSERPLAYCKNSMAILEPHGGQYGFRAFAALQSVQRCRRWVSTPDTSRLVLFFSLLHHQCFSCNGWANQKPYWTKVVGSALYLPLGFSSISKKEAPIGVPGTSIRSVPPLRMKGSVEVQLKAQIGFFLAFPITRYKWSYLVINCHHWS